MIKIQSSEYAVDFTDELISSSRFPSKIAFDTDNHQVYYVFAGNNTDYFNLYMYDVSNRKNVLIISTVKTIEIIGCNKDNVIYNQINLDPAYSDIVMCNINSKKDNKVIDRAIGINCKDKYIIYYDFDDILKDEKKYWVYNIENGLKTNFCTNKYIINNFIFSDNKIIWADKRVDDKKLENVMIYDLKTNKKTKCNIGYVQGDISVYGDYIIWEDDLNCNGTKNKKGITDDDGDIYGYQISTGKIFPIETSDEYTSSKPAVTGTKVFWLDRIKGGSVVSYADIADEKIVAKPASTVASSKSSYKLGLVADGDIVVWEDERFQKDANNSIFGYCISKDAEIQLTKRQGRYRLLAVSYPYIVYGIDYQTQGTSNSASELRLITIK
jgi:hypothetical protein